MQRPTDGKLVRELPVIAPEPRGGGRPDRRLSRRDALRWLIRLGAGAFGLAFALPALALKSLSLEQQVIVAGDRLEYATGPAAGQALIAAEIGPGMAVQAFPRGKADNQNNLVQVVRIGPGQGAENLVAFSAICTHLGCAVSGRLDGQGLIGCPCHASRFDPANRAAVIGGPAPRPLPVLPVAVGSDGTLVADGSFDGPIGQA